MAKKSKPTREFSPMAKRIYTFVHKAISSRATGMNVMRQIDKEIEKIKVGSPDLELFKEVANLKGRLADDDKVLKEHAGVVAELENKYNSEIEKIAAESQGWESEHGKLQEEFQKVSNENDERGLKIIHLEEKIAGMEPAGSDPAEKEELLERPSGDPKEEIKDPADESESEEAKAGSGEPSGQPAK